MSEWVPLSSPRQVVVRCLATLVFACAAPRLASEEWTAVLQPKLKAELAKAPGIEPEAVAEPARSVMSWTFQSIPNPDGEMYDGLQWYYKGYAGPTWVYICDFATGKIRKQRFPNGRQIHYHGGTLAPDGKYYIVTQAQSKGMHLFVYDPAANRLEDRGIIVPNLFGETRPLALGPDGLIYGTGSYRESKKAGAYAFDWKTGKVVRNYGPVGPSHDPHPAWGRSIGVDNRFIYVVSGMIPWYLVAIDIKSGEQKVIAETKAGGEIRISPMSGGARARIVAEPGAPQEHFWLHHGKLIPKTGDTPPWKPFKSPRDLAPPRPEIYRDQVDPVDGTSYLWWRSAEAKEKYGKATAAADPATTGWKRLQLEDVETYPLPIHRLTALSDGRIFGTAQGYGGRFLFDPKTGKSTALGNGGPSIYALAAHQDKLYFSGYPIGPIDVFDPAKPWTLQKGGPPGRKPPHIRSPTSNPRRLVVELVTKTRVNKMFATALGADGRIYFAGVGLRNYVGGSLAWFDPETGEFDGVWRPFSGFGIHWLTTALDGRYIIASTRTARDELNNDKRAASARIFVWDTETQSVVRDFAPVPNAGKAGPVVEVSPGRLLGLTEDPEARRGGILYGADAGTGKILFTKKLPDVLRFNWAAGSGQWDFVLGPDKKIYTYLGYVLVRIHPDNARIEPLSRLKKTGRMCFVGNNLYLAGDVALRRFRNVVGRKQVKTPSHKLQSPSRAHVNAPASWSAASQAALLRVVESNQVHQACSQFHAPQKRSARPHSKTLPRLQHVGVHASACARSPSLIRAFREIRGSQTRNSKP